MFCLSSLNTKIEVLLSRTVLSSYFECREGLYGTTVSIEYQIFYWIWLIVKL